MVRRQYTEGKANNCSGFFLVASARMFAQGAASSCSKNLSPDFFYSLCPCCIRSGVVFQLRCFFSFLFSTACFSEPSLFQFDTNISQTELDGTMQWSREESPFLFEISAVSRHRWELTDLTCCFGGVSSSKLYSEFLEWQRPIERVYIQAKRLRWAVVTRLL